MPGLIEPQTMDGESGYFFDGGVADIAGLAGVSSSERVFYHHCTVAPLWSTGVSKFPQDQATTLNIRGLPIMHPLNMHRGTEAYEFALQATRRSLNAPRFPVIRVAAGATGARL